MEEEIDLRPYIQVVVNKWYWLAAVGLVAALAAMATSMILPERYEATALVTITSDQQMLQFDPRIQNEVTEQPLQAYPELATADVLMAQLLNELALPPDEVDSVNSLGKKLTAAAGNDPSLIRLTAEDQDPETAARIANTWAEAYVDWVNGVYNDPTGEQLAFFEAQLEDARTELTTAETTLVEFQTRNRLSIVQNRLSALNHAQSTYLSDRQRITFLLEDIAGLRGQLANNGSTAVVFADQLAALNLQLSAFNANSGSSLQFQINSDSPLTTENRTELLATLDGLTSALNGRLADIEQKLTDLEPEILALQGERQTLETEAQQLNRDVTIAAETYTTLSRKVDEERIASQDNMSQVKLVSDSAVPVEPAGTGTLVSMVLAGIVGVMVAVGVLFVSMWWRGIEGSNDVSAELTAVAPQNGKRQTTASRSNIEYDPAGD